jgi:hypothetical protein
MNDNASIIEQCRPRLVIRSVGDPLVIYTLDNITRITRMIVVPDEIWDGPDWASYRPDDAPDDAPAAVSVPVAEPVPTWLESPPSRAMAALMNERMIAAAEADSIATAVDDAHVMLAMGDLDAVDHLLGLINEAASAVASALSKPPTSDLA